MLIIAHLSLMIAGSLCLAAGIGMARYGRQKKYWLRWHKNFNITGLCLLVTGASMAFVNVVLSNDRHLAWVHQWVGLIALILTCVTMFLGFYISKAVNKPAVRGMHRWMGRISGAAILLALSLGVIMIGIL